MNLNKNNSYGYIYFLFIGDKLIYIWQTLNLKSRLSQHKKKNYTSYRSILCQVDKLRYYENRLIKYFKPSMNCNSFIQSEAFGISVTTHFLSKIKAAADEAGLKPGTFVKAVVKKHIKYREPNLV